MKEVQLSKSAAAVAKSMYAAMKILRSNDGQMSYSQLKQAVSETVEFTDWELSYSSEKMKKEGHPRWMVNMSYYSIDYSKAGFIRKQDGIWYLTAEGEKALSLSPEEVFSAAHTAYREWAKENNKYENMDADVKDIKESTPKMVADEAESAAMEEIRQYIASMNPYEFQELIAALLRGMGYYTPFIADKGKDGGIDVIAYENAAGVGNRLIVQVKHMPTTALDVTVVRNLAALVKKDTDSGLVVTSGRFTSESLRFAREQRNNIRCIDGGELISLWITHYNRILERDKQRLPLRPIYFVDLPE